MEIDLAGIPVQYVESGSTRIAYRSVGQGAPVLLIMGLGADGTAWQLHVQEFAKHFRCIVPDNRGAGGSDAPVGPYSTAQMADDCAAVLLAASDRPANVVGISMGGTIAQELALNHPSLVSRMVLVSSWCRCDPFLADMFHHLREAQAALMPDDFAELLQLRIWSPLYYSAHAEELRNTRRETKTAMSPAAFAAQCAACISHDALARLEGVTAPTLITAGNNDSFTVLDRALEVQEAIRGSRLEVLPGGHAHHWEALKDFNDLTISWLAAQGQSATSGPGSDTGPVADRQIQ